LAYLYSYKYFESGDYPYLGIHSTRELVDFSWYVNNGFPDSARAAIIVIAAAGAISGAPSLAALFAPFGGIATRPQAVHNNLEKSLVPSIRLTEGDLAVIGLPPADPKIPFSDAPRATV
jgi:hypothetical protein